MAAGRRLPSFFPCPVSSGLPPYLPARVGSRYHGSRDVNPRARLGYEAGGREGATALLPSQSSGLAYVYPARLGSQTRRGSGAAGAEGSMPDPDAACG
jgi:hypothetical protein